MRHSVNQTHASTNAFQQIHGATLISYYNVILIIIITIIILDTYYIINNTIPTVSTCHLKFGNVFVIENAKFGWNPEWCEKLKLKR